MSIQREFPSYDDMKGFADLLAKLPGFVDSSWHNDTCPSMEHVPARMTDMNDAWAKLVSCDQDVINIIRWWLAL